MIPLEEARQHVLDRCPAPGPAGEPVGSIDDALGCVLAVDVRAPEPVPPFDNSAMDGFAVRARDLEGASSESPVRLTVVGTIAAGDAPDVAVAPNAAVRIMTGAPVPPGADAVVPVELSRTVDGAPDLIDLSDSPALGRHIRPAGDDMQEGDLVVPAGTLLGPAHLGVLASANARHPRVFRRPVVAVISTGDELVDDGSPLSPGQIRESNRPLLVSALRSWGFDAHDHGSIRDDHAVLSSVLLELADSVDAIVTSGGVSMGDFDVVKQVLADVAEMAWMQIAIRPAKPFAFGLIGATPVFGLPGNPVSSFVSLALLGVPGLRKMAGRSDLDLPAVTATASVDLPRPSPDRTSFVRVDCSFVEGAFRATPVGAQGSHQLAATAGANGLAIVPPGEARCAGDQVEVFLLRDPLAP